MVRKTDVLQALLTKLRKKFGGDVATTLGSDGTRAEVTEVVPMGLGPIDRYVIGIGGLPVGRITEVYSEEGVGKTSLGLAVCASAQKDGGQVIIVETETALQPERGKAFGMDLGRVILLQPDCMEDALDQMGACLDGLPNGGTPSVMLWDSVAATPTRQEMEDGLIGKDAIGVRARLLSRMCRSLVALAARKRVAMVFINQTRMKIGVMFGDPVTTPGGQAVKFAASVRLQLWGGKMLKDGATAVGRYVTIKATKNKLSPPFRKVQTLFRFGTGWDDAWTTLNYAKELDLVPERSRGEKALEEARAALDACNWSAHGIDNAGPIMLSPKEGADADDGDDVAADDSD
jgi:recombination protein RecA